MVVAKEESSKTFIHSSSFMQHPQCNSSNHSSNFMQQQYRAAVAISCSSDIMQQQKQHTATMQCSSTFE